jgi:hypothetical protein
MHQNHTTIQPKKHSNPFLTRSYHLTLTTTMTGATSEYWIVSKSNPGTSIAINGGIFQSQAVAKTFVAQQQNDDSSEYSVWKISTQDLIELSKHIIQDSENITESIDQPNSSTSASLQSQPPVEYWIYYFSRNPSSGGVFPSEEAARERVCNASKSNRAILGKVSRDELIEVLFASKKTSRPDDGFSQDEYHRFHLFRALIEHEDNLLNHRVSWVLLSQSFLMAAFVAANGGGDTNDAALRYVTSGVGIFTILVTLPAIFEAARNIQVHEDVYFAKMTNARCEQLHGHSSSPRTYSRDGCCGRGVKDEGAKRKEKGHIFPTTTYRGKGLFGMKIGIRALLLMGGQLVGWILLLIAFVLEW